MSVVGVMDVNGSIGPGAGSLVATGLVLAALVVLAWLLRRGTIAIGPLGRNKQAGFAVETAFSLGERRSLAVVSVEGRRLVLGLTPTTVTLITELAHPEGSFGSALARQTAVGERA